MTKTPDLAGRSASTPTSGVAPRSTDPGSPADSPAVSPAGALDEIYLLYAPLLRRVAVRKFRVSPADAEGLVHDVFINLLTSTRPVRSDLRGYLIGAICNASRNYWRSKKSEHRLFADDDPAYLAAVSEDIFDGLELNLVVASTLARLGERCREVLRRYYLDGEDTVTIAAAMSTSPANVNYLMHVCRKRAREAYETISRGPS